VRSYIVANAAITITLPNINLDTNIGRSYTIIKNTANSVTVNTFGTSDKIQGIDSVSPTSSITLAGGIYQRINLFAMTNNGNTGGMWVTL
jgi:hypothetical protein